MPQVTTDSQRQWTAAELRGLPPEMRDAILAAAAERALDEYRNDAELTEFQAFGEKDLLSTVRTPSRGEVWLLDFDPAVGAEIRKLRPALVISVDSVGRLPLRLVVPLTDWKSQFAGFPWFVSIPADATNGLTKDSGADAFQTKSVSLERFVRRLRSITAAQADDVASAIALCVGAP